MAKKKDGNGAAQPGMGHNGLTDDEKRALTLHHKRLYEAADALVESAKADRTAVADLAKSDLGKGALADIKDMILADNPKKMKSVLERAQRLARWAGLKVGSQPQLFEAAQVDHAEEGKTAGMSGATCEPPKNLAHDAQQKWIGGWHEGQTILSAAFKKKRPIDGAPAAQDGQIDLEEAIAKFGDRVDLTADEEAKGYTAAFMRDGSRVAVQLRA
jgi:ribosome modulation factor